jgi:hypothetical protein
MRNPRSRCCSRSSVWISRPAPAPTSRISDSEICAVTSIFLSPCREAPLLDRPPSFSTQAAFTRVLTSAGTMPKNKHVDSPATSVNTTTRQSSVATSMRNSRPMWNWYRPRR